MKQTKIIYSIQKCIVKYNNNIYTINLNYNSLLRKELNYIILKKLTNNIKVFYLLDLKINNNNILQGKESLENSGEKIEILSLKIVNKYYDKELYIMQKDLYNYNINGLSEKISIRNYFNKINYNELLNYGNIFPLYMINQKIEINLENIFSYFLIEQIKNPILIKKTDDIQKINLNFYLNNLNFYFNITKAKRINKFNLTILKNKFNIINNNLNIVKNYLLLNNIKNNFLIKDLILFKKDWKYGNYYYLNICGFKIKHNKFYLTKINNNFNTIIKIKLYKNYLLYNKTIKIPLSYIDNNNISLHDNIENAKKLNYIKLKFINKIIKETK